MKINYGLIKRDDFEKVAPKFKNPIVSIVKSGLSRSNEALDNKENDFLFFKNDTTNKPFLQESKSANHLDAKSMRKWSFDKQDSTRNCESESNISLDVETTRL